MQFDFTPVLERLPYLVGGAWLSLQIAFLAFALGMLLGLAGASVRAYGPRWARRRDRSHSRPCRPPGHG